MTQRNSNRTFSQRGFTSALLFGVTAGLRTMTAPALLSLAQQRPGGGRIWLLASPRTAQVLTVLAMGELVLDKLPFMPARTTPGGLSGRLLSGAMCGAAVVPEDQRAGALLGIVGALVSSFAGYAIRKSAVRASGLPDAVVALAEDALAIGTGLAATALEGDESAQSELPSARVA